MLSSAFNKLLAGSQQENKTGDVKDVNNDDFDADNDFIDENEFDSPKKENKTENQLNTTQNTEVSPKDNNNSALEFDLSDIVSPPPSPSPATSLNVSPILKNLQNLDPERNKEKEKPPSELTLHRDDLEEGMKNLEPTDKKSDSEQKQNKDDDDFDLEDTREEEKPKETTEQPKEEPKVEEKEPDHSEENNKTDIKKDSSFSSDEFTTDFGDTIKSQEIQPPAEEKAPETNNVQEEPKEENKPEEKPQEETPKELESEKKEDGKHDSFEASDFEDKDKDNNASEDKKDEAEKKSSSNDEKKKSSSDDEKDFEIKEEEHPVHEPPKENEEKDKEKKNSSSSSDNFEDKEEEHKVHEPPKEKEEPEHKEKEEDSSSGVFIEDSPAEKEKKQEEDDQKKEEEKPISDVIHKSLDQVSFKFEDEDEENKLRKENHRKSSIILEDDEDLNNASTNNVNDSPLKVHEPPPRSTDEQKKMWDLKEYIEAAPVIIEENNEKENKTQKKEDEVFPTAPPSTQESARAPRRTTQNKQNDFSTSQKGPYNYTYSKADLEKGINTLKKNKFPDQHMSQDLDHYLEEKMEKCVINSQYSEAEQYENLQKFLESFVDYSPLERSRQIQLKENQTKLDRAKDRHEYVKKQYAEAIENAKQDQIRREEQLRQQHEKEIEELAKVWESPETLYPFQKPSPQLLYLRQNETHFALSKKFRRAKSFKVQADELQKRETLQARERITAAMKQAFLKLEAKQQKEIECLRQRGYTQIRDLETERDKKLYTSMIVVRRLENAKPKDGTITRTSYRAKPLKGDSNMRSKMTTLDIGPVNVKSIVKRMRSPESPRKKSKEENNTSFSKSADF